MAMPRFPFFDLTRQYQTIKTEVMPEVEKIFEKQAFVMGEPVNSFESDLARYIGVKHAVTCGSGTDALVLALKALDIGPGDEVLTTPFSFFASTSCILLTGAKPVFADIDPVSFNIDPTKLEKALTKKTKAVLPVHLFGQMAEMNEILEFAKKHGLPVVEDFAQSIGATYHGKQAGSIGTLGATSFYPTKNLGGAGEGGLVTTNDDGLAEKLKLLRVHGMKVRYTHDVLGWNSRLDALQAAVLRVKLRHLNTWVKRRRQLASQYQEMLGDVKNIMLPKTLTDHGHVWNQYCVLVPRRDEVRARLEERGIPTDIFYPKTIPAQPVLKQMGFNENGIPVSMDCAARALALPIFPELTDDEQKQVASALRETLQAL